MKPKQLFFLEGGPGLLPSIHELWEAQRDYQAGRSIHHRRLLASTTFEARTKSLLRKSGNGKRLRVILAQPAGSDTPVGYCIATVNPDREGEIDSLYLKPDYRSHRIGEKLLKRGLAWLSKNKARNIVIEVAVGNERVLGFYRKAGFLPFTILLRTKA